MTVVIKTKRNTRQASLSSVMSETFASYKKISPRILEIASTPSSYVEHGDDWSGLVKQAIVAELSSSMKEAKIEIGSWEATENADGVPVVRVEFNKELSSMNNSFTNEVKDTLSNMATNEDPYIVLDVACIEGDQFGGVMLLKFDVSKIRDASDRMTALSAAKANLKALMRTKYRIANLSFSSLNIANAHLAGFQVIY